MTDNGPKYSKSPGRGLGRLWLVVVIIPILALGIGSAAFFLLSPKNAAPLPPKHPVVDPAPASVSAPKLAPNTLSIPSLNITAPLTQISLANHSLQVPGNVHVVGVWDQGGQLNGAVGTVLLTGHVNYYNQGEGALWNLAGIHINAPIYASDSSGQVTAWKVDQVLAVPKSSLPQSIFTNSGQRQMVIVTCGGQLLNDGHYADNVIVLATPVPVKP